MKAEFDKEIDALLRRSLRAAGRGARAPEAAPPTPHLDADELGAFAENALPAPARLAAVAHLADCDECRGAAVTLSRAAGELEKRAVVPVAVDPSEVAGGGWLAALFSPRLLRFVAPALALCLVGAVAFVVLRTRQGAGEVAQQAPSAPEAPRPGIVADGDADARANMNANMSMNANVNTGTSTATTANTSANVAPHLHDSAVAPPAAEPTRPAPPGNYTLDGVDSGDADAAKQAPADAAKTVTAPPPPPPAPAAAAEARPIASAPAQPPPAARDAQKRKKEDERKAEDDEVARADEVQQERRGNLGEAQQTPDGGSRNRSSNNVYGGGRGAMRREPERSSRSVTGSQSRGAAGAGAARDESAPAGETRAAGGHRFRREGNAWVDVNYRSSMSMTGVRRGTEAFRALVADIPEIGRIAEQLSGEVITVVRGRAYRIR